MDGMQAVPTVVVPAGDGMQAITVITGFVILNVSTIAIALALAKYALGFASKKDVDNLSNELGQTKEEVKELNNRLVSVDRNVDILVTVIRERQNEKYGPPEGGMQDQKQGPPSD